MISLGKAKNQPAHEAFLTLLVMRLVPLLTARFFPR
jgi:hypothetical protein